VGHLFQDRFKSEVVETDSYLKEIIRYIHHNPLKADVYEDALDIILCYSFSIKVSLPLGRAYFFGWVYPMKKIMVINFN